MAEKSNKNGIANMLSYIAMGVGQGMTGQPFLSNFQAMQSKNKESEEAMRQFRAEQDIKLASAGLVPDPQGSYNIGGQTYSKRPPMMPDLSALGLNGGSNGLGLTGATVNQDGNISFNIGQTPESKGKQDVQTQVSKDAMGRVQKLQELIPVLDQFDSLMKTLPTDVGVKGRIAGYGKVLGGVTQSDPFAATAIAHADALRPQIARGFGDVGNLSKPEQETAKKFIPLTEDSMDTRAVKSLAGLVFIKNKLNNSITKSGLSGDEGYQKILSEIDTRVNAKYNEAMALGVDKKRLNDFLGLAGGKLDDVHKKISTGMAQKIFIEAGKDPAKARKLAADRGFTF